jgi:hypothetical protein
LFIKLAVVARARHGDKTSKHDVRDRRRKGARRAGNRFVAELETYWHVIDTPKLHERMHNDACLAESRFIIVT